jgi:hypothetical protein
VVVRPGSEARRRAGDRRRGRRATVLGRAGVEGGPVVGGWTARQPPAGVEEEGAEVEDVGGRR